MSVIDIRELCKTFQSGLPFRAKKQIHAVDHISFTVRKGEVFGLLGPNGSGKTTLIRILLGLIRPTDGNARVLGYDILNESNKIRQYCSLLPQEAGVIETLTARENILYYGGMHGLDSATLNRRTEELIDLVGLRGRENDLTKEFSGGMKRKTLVARALVPDPKLIFLDEPTTGVDILGARTVRNLVKKLSREEGRTIFLTTHDLYEVNELCDRVGIMVRGKLAAIGKPTELEELFGKANLLDVFEGLVTGEGIEEGV
ncbi:MAG: ABC transporter ATP-binding protein [Candidatus Hodarchaeota archaeon]